MSRRFEGEVDLVRQEFVERTVAVPDNVTVQVDGRHVSVKGPLGSLEEDLSHLPVALSQKEKNVVISTTWPRKRELGMLGTAAAHVRNMFKGVTDGYRYELKGVYAHFPVTVKADEKRRVVDIENFTGEKTPRHAKILENVKVTVKGDDLVVEGPNLANVSQTAANIQNATRIKQKDLRVFLDGIYISGKGPMKGAAPEPAAGEKKKSGGGKK